MSDSVSKLVTLFRDPLNLQVERDRSFTATKTLGEYAKEAYAAERIVTWAPPRHITTGGGHQEHPFL
jgi:hypothetical protein